MLSLSTHKNKTGHGVKLQDSVVLGVKTPFNPLRTVVTYMHQGNKLDYHVQTNRYSFAALHPTNLKLLSFCSVYSAENSNVLG